ncbi:anthrone oxygenase family protein [Acidicapsa dinghuensis]|uniref:Anthrone oxygenase family protein n=1 Tax=Acidicapsa dinghuensis TaxID=2218256 RepID=A0ABW1EDE2_9BACT|nr:DUF1772 domain-containing protein [Acidicapsa dinghuensis]
MLILDIATIVSVGMMTGVEFAVSAFVNPVVLTMEDGAQAFATRAFARLLGRMMPFWYVGNMLLLAGEAVMRHGQSGSAFLYAACGVWAAVIALTLMFLVPINNRIAAMPDGAFARAMKAEHHVWDLRHRVRIAALMVATVLLLVAIGAVKCA